MLARLAGGGGAEVAFSELGTLKTHSKTISNNTTGYSTLSATIENDGVYVIVNWVAFQYYVTDFYVSIGGTTMYRWTTPDIDTARGFSNITVPIGYIKKGTTVSVNVVRMYVGNPSGAYGGSIHIREHNPL